jgi:hypothetical protein
LNRPPTLDRPKAEFSGFAQGDGLVTPPDFVSMIGALLPIAWCGRSSLQYLRQQPNHGCENCEDQVLRIGQGNSFRRSSSFKTGFATGC